MSISKYKRRFWALYDTDGSLICVLVYRKGAEEVKRRLTQQATSQPITTTPPVGYNAD